MEALKILNICKFCGKEINDKGMNGGRKSFCSYKCSQENARLKIKNANISRKLGLNTGETGQICEMLVTIDLIKRGFKVYLPFDTTDSFDLLVEKERKYEKIQVKAGFVNFQGIKMKPQLKHHKYDKLAIVYNLNEIVYSEQNVI